MMVVPTAAHELLLSAVKRTYHLKIYIINNVSLIGPITYEFLYQILSKPAHSDVLPTFKYDISSNGNQNKDYRASGMCGRF